MDVVLVKRAWDGEQDRAYLSVGAVTRRGPVHVVHDLPHLVVESLFGIGDGLWGELAAGAHAAVGAVTTARDAKTRKRGRIVSGAATGAPTDSWLSDGHRLAKTVTNAVTNRWGEGPDTPAGVRVRLAAQGIPDLDALLARVSDEQIAAAIQGVRALEQRWLALPPGGTLRLTWPLSDRILDETGTMARMTSPNPVDALRLAIATERAVLDCVRPDQLALPSPCAGWDVAALINHTIGAYATFAAAMTGGSVAAADHAAGDHLAAFDAATAACLAGFEADGAMERTVRHQFGEIPAAVAISMITTDGLVHAWDLARATGQSTDLAPELSAGVLAGCQQSVTPELRGTDGTKPFGPEQPVADDAPVADKLAAFLGRTV
jgi:uncharacterized protein (TIGR03086 family)